jgi:hypothetical protein
MKLKYFPIKMSWSKQEVPHGMIEVNQKCNISCDGCYKNKFNFEKSLEEIKREVDLLARKRNLAAITIAGGEPTLYKDLNEVVRYISSKNIRPILLTNGTLLTKERILELKKNGLARIAIHIDRHQNKRPDSKPAKKDSELNFLRKKYVDLCYECGMNSVLQLTLYKDNLKEFLDVVDFAQKLPDTNLGILITLYSNTADIKKENKILEITNEYIIKLFYEEKGLVPTYYLPSSNDENSLRWVFYNSFMTIDKTGVIHKLNMHPKNKTALKLFSILPRIIKGRYSFEDPRTQKQTFFALSLYGLLSFSPKTFYKCMKFKKLAKSNENLKIFSLLFQQGPKKLANGKYDTCKNCPDSTVRNGKIMPICLADQISPIKIT